MQGFRALHVSTVWEEKKGQWLVQLVCLPMLHVNPYILWTHLIGPHSVCGREPLQRGVYKDVGK